MTIILPTVAMESKEKYTDEEWNALSYDERIDIFMKYLDVVIHDAKDMLLERFEYICSQPPESAQFMYENHTMAGYVPEEGIRSALKHGTLALGQLDLATTLRILIGHDQTEEVGMVQAKKIEQLFKDRCNEFKNEYKLNFGCYYTPEHRAVGANMVTYCEKAA